MAVAGEGSVARVGVASPAEIQLAGQVASHRPGDPLALLLAAHLHCTARAGGDASQAGSLMHIAPPHTQMPRPTGS